MQSVFLTCSTMSFAPAVGGGKAALLGVVAIGASPLVGHTLRAVGGCA
jgi:hypothetical protein